MLLPVSNPLGKLIAETHCVIGGKALQDNSEYKSCWTDHMLAIGVILLLKLSW